MADFVSIGCCPDRYQTCLIVGDSGIGLYSHMAEFRKITLPTMSRVFKALGIASATLDLGAGGKVALW